MISDEEFERIARYLKKRYGIDMGNKKIIMNGRLENYVSNHGYKNYTEFIDAIEAAPGGETELQLVNMLTTNHTYFMREADHFDYMRDTVIPWIRKREAVSRDMRIWCGASSTGEEPYELAILTMETLGIDEKRWDTSILATDISEEVLHKAISGIYEEEQISALPEAWKRKYFRHISSSKMYQATDELKKHVIYRKFNLMDDFPFRKQLHVIFMRNVMIYFDEPTKKKLIHKIYDALLPGGYLFVGKTETIDKEGTDFEMIQPSIFRKPLR